LVVVLAAVLLATAPALAQSGPDAAPSGSSGGPTPDPAPTAKRPAKRVATPPAVVRTTTSPAPAPAQVAPTQHDGAGHRKATKPSTHRSSAAKRRSAKAPAAALSLPRLTPAHLVAPGSDADDQARRLAIGGLSLLLLALASAMLLAFTLRVDRDRTLR
jgi:hypothetical protein